MIPPLAALFSYPIVIFSAFRAVHWQVALIWTILLGHMFLPVKRGIDLPLLPALNKTTIPALCALALLFLLVRPGMNKSVQDGWLPKDMLSRLAVIALIGGAFLTVITNMDQVVIGWRRLPALRIYDGFASVLTVIMMLLPLLLARKYLATDNSHRLILKHLCLAGFIYSFLNIFELVMSPQLNTIVYGYFPHSWKQHLRNGGYRPLGFMGHGLILAIFMCCTVIAAAVYARVTDASKKVRYFQMTGWLFLILAASNSLGALAIAVVFLPVALLLRARMQLMFAAGVAATLLIYPALRGADMVPTNLIVQWAASVDQDRAASLKFRLDNEDRLLDKANQRPLFGWGGWSRARVYDENGVDISVTDGEWAIQIGQAGWLGYFGQFGLLCIPTILLFFRSRKIGVGLATSGLSLVLIANVIDLIPNSGLTPVTWLVAGALIGRLELKSAEDDAPSPDAVPVPNRRSPYTRFAPQHPARARPGLRGGEVTGAQSARRHG